MIRTFMLATALYLISACAGTANVPANAQQAMGKVGVVALVGDDLALVHTGISGFTSNAAAVDVTNWEIDRYIVDSLSQILQQRDYQVVQTTYTQQELETIYVPGPGSLDWKPDRVATQLRGIAEQSGVDTLILVLRRSSPDFIHVTHDDDEYYRESLTGLGLYDRRTVISHVTTATFANIALLVLDADTLRPIAKGTAQRHTTVQTDFWHKEYTKKRPELVAADAPALRQEIENIVSATLEQAAADLKL